MRFSELRPAKVDTNLFTYHLNALVKLGYVLKVDEGYTLDTAGLAYIDRIAAGDATGARQYPEVQVMFVVQNGDGDILLRKRKQQPHIDSWSLPQGKVRIDDKSLKDAASQQVFQVLGLENPTMSHAGDCYVRVKIDKKVFSSVMVHVFLLYIDEVTTDSETVWARPNKLDDYELAPAVNEIMTRTFFKDPFFFEEYDLDLA